MSGLIRIQTVLHSGGIYLKEFFEKVDFEKNRQTTKKHEKLPSRQSVRDFTCKPLPLLVNHRRPLTTLNGILCAPVSASTNVAFHSHGADLPSPSSNLSVF